MEEKNASSDKYAISTIDLTKDFPSLKAVDKVNLKIKFGEIYSLIGPNGAGKSTLVKLLVGLLAPSKGQAIIGGFDISKQPIEAKQQFGYVSDNPQAYDYLTGNEFLILTGKLRQLSENMIKERIHQLTPLFPIKDILNTQMANYSRGNRQKVAFLGALLPKPKILIIDEPIAGLDPTSIEIFGKTLKNFAKNGGAVLFVTHILSFGQLYADKLGVMDKGKIIKEEIITPKTAIDKIYNELIKEG